MTRTHTPSNLTVWLQRIDVNGLTDEECNYLSKFDIEDDDDLDVVINKWLMSWYASHSVQNRQTMRDVIAQSSEWDDRSLRRVFDQIWLPSGQGIVNIHRFLDALRAAVLKSPNY